MLDQSYKEEDVGALLGAAKARCCSVLVIPEPLGIPRALQRFDRRGLSRYPMLIQGLVEGTARGLAARLRWPPERSFEPGLFYPGILVKTPLFHLPGLSHLVRGRPFHYFT
jgi:hypothetical protein